MKTFLIFLALSTMYMISTIGIVNARELTCADNPTELWHFSEGNGTNTEDSCFSINATLYGDMSWDNGIYGNAVRFNGINTYVDAGNIFPFNQNMPEFSFSLWVNFSNPNAVAWQTLFRSGYYNPPSEFVEAIQINEGDGNNYLLFMASSSNQIKIIDDGAWHYLVGTFNGTSQTSKIYIDGDFINEVNVGISEITATTSPLYFGFNFDNGFLLNGVLDEVAFFNRTLTQQEVLEYYSDLAISNITIIPSFTNAEISWNTNENANGTVCYWLDGFNETCSNNPAFILSHNFMITGLSVNTTYNYYVKSCSNICKQSLNYTFQTGNSLISSVYVKDNQIFKQDSNGINLTAICYADGNSFCNSLTTCKLSVINNGNILLDNVIMEYHTNYYSYNALTLTALGDYSATVICIGNNIEYTNFAFKITPNGTVSTSGEAFIYSVLIIILVCLFILALIGGIKFEHIALKYFFFLSAYLLFIGITFISWNLSLDYLTSSPFLTSFFRILWWVSIGGLIPVILIGTFYTIWMMIQIKEIQRMIDKGIPSDEAYERVVRKGFKSKRW
jgi:hypothetical protein